MKKYLLSLLLTLWASAASAGVTCTLPFNLQNGTTADATQVMANYNQLVTCLGAAAAAGANADITSLLALTTPISPSQGGSTAYAGGTSAGSANAQTLAITAPTGFSLVSGYTVSFVAGFTNTTAMTLTVNGQTVPSTSTPSCSSGTCPPMFLRQTPAGPQVMSGGEVQAGQLITAVWDGARFQMISNGPQYGGYGPLTNLASNTTADLGTIPSHNINITGNTTITAFGSSAVTNFPKYRLTFASILLLTYNATSLILPGGISITTAAGDTAEATYLGSGNWQITDYVRANGTPLNFNAIFLQGYRQGLTLSTAGASSTFGVATGIAADSTNATMMQLSSAYTKTTSSWAVGSGNGCLDTGAIANNTWYHVFEIQRTDTGVVDIVCSATATPASGPTLMPTSYTLFRRIGSMKTDASAHWIQFTQTGNSFVWAANAQDFNGNSVTGSRTLTTLSVPPGVVVRALFRVSAPSTSGIEFIYTSPQENDVAPTTSFADMAATNGLSTNGQFAIGMLARFTNTSAQIGRRANSAGQTEVINTYGWDDFVSQPN